MATQVTALLHGLGLHHRQTTDRSTQCRLVDDHPEPGRVGARQYPLAGDPQADSAFNLLSVRAAVTEPDNGAGILHGLHQPGNELDLVAADERRGRLQPQIGLEPAG